MTNIDYEIVNSKEGNSTIVINREGKKIPLHSRIAPTREALSLEDKFDERYEMLIVLGAGLGYHLEPLKIKKFTKIVIIDIIPSIEEEIKKNELTKYLFEKKNIKFVTGKDLDFIKEILNKEIDFEQVTGIKVVEHPSSIRIFNEYYTSVAKLIKEIIDNKAGNSATKNALGKRFLLNIVKNFSLMGNYFGVSNLFNRFQGESVIVLTSGPSAEKVMPNIKKNRESFYIVAVDSAISVLNGYGVDADFVISIDPQSHITEHLLPFKLNGAIPIFSISSYPTLLRKYSGFITLNTHPFSQLFEELYPNTIGSIDSKTGTVAGDAISFAMRCGFSNIGIVGYDFSFSQKKIYARGTAYQKRFGEFFANRLKGVIDFNISYIRKASNSYKFEGKDSRKSFVSYKNSIEELLRIENRKIYNIERTGLTVKGAEDIFLSEFLKLKDAKTDRKEKISEIIKPLKYLRNNINFSKIEDIMFKEGIFEKLMNASIEKQEIKFLNKIKKILNRGK